MIQAARRGDAAIVKELLAQGASVEAQENLGNSALTCAVEDTQMECAAVLLENGAEVNTRSYNGYSPLILSAIKGQKKMAQMLMENGAAAAGRGNRRQSQKLSGSNGAVHFDQHRQA